MLEFSELYVFWPADPNLSVMRSIQQKSWSINFGAVHLDADN